MKKYLRKNTFVISSIVLLLAIICICHCIYHSIQGMKYDMSSYQVDYYNYKESFDYTSKKVQHMYSNKKANSDNLVAMHISIYANNLMLIDYDFTDDSKNYQETVNMPKEDMEYYSNVIKAFSENNNYGIMYCISVSDSYVAFRRPPYALVYIEKNVNNSSFLNSSVFYTRRIAPNWFHLIQKTK